MPEIRLTTDPARRPPGCVGYPLLNVRDVTARRAGRGNADAINLTVRSGEIVGICGVAGNGQGVLADLLSGLYAPDPGTIMLAGKAQPQPGAAEFSALGVGRISDDRHGTGSVGGLTVAENLILENYRQSRFSRWFGSLRAAAIRDHATRLIAGYDLRGGDPDTLVRQLSGLICDAP